MTFNSINDRIDSLVSNLTVMTDEIGNNLKLKANIKATNLLLKKIILLEKIKENYKKKTSYAEIIQQKTKHFNSWH